MNFWRRRLSPLATPLLINLNGTFGYLSNSCQPESTSDLEHIAAVLYPRMIYRWSNRPHSKLYPACKQYLLSSLSRFFRCNLEGLLHCLLFCMYQHLLLWRKLRYSKSCQVHRLFPNLFEGKRKQWYNNVFTLRSPN